MTRASYATKICGYCNNPTRNKTFCSKACSGLKKVTDGIFQLIVSGKFPPHPLTSRKYLEILYGWKCSICNSTEWLKEKIPLILDHIDGNSENWSVDNIRFVCPNCDAQLPTYKGRNKGHGRFKRSQRYRQGLSY